MLALADMTREYIKRFAGSTTFERGEGYYRTASVSPGKNASCQHIIIMIQFVIDSSTCRIYNPLDETTLSFYRFVDWQIYRPPSGS